MAIDPNIALGVRGIEIANPLAQYGQLSQIQNYQNQNALAQYQLATAQREQESVNALNQAYAKAYNPQTGEVDINTLRQTLSTGGFGSKLPGLEKTFGELQKQKLETEKLKGEVTAQPTKLEAEKSNLIDAKLKQARSFLDTINPSDPSAPEAFMAWHQANHADPLIGPVLKARGVTPEQSMARIQQAIQAGPQAFSDLINQSKLGTEKFIELNKPSTFAQDTGVGGRLMTRPGLGGAATVVPGSEFTKGKTFADITAERQANLSASRLAFDQNKFAWEKANPGFELKEAEDGSIVGVNKRTLQAFPVTVGGAAPAAAPMAGAGMPGARLPAAPVQAIPGMTSVLDQQAPAAAPAAGTPLMGKGTAMTEAQSNAAMFGGAMAQAQNTIKQLEKSGTVKNAVVPGLLTGLAQMVPFGVGENIGNVIQSTFNADPTGLIGPNAEQQKLAQSQLAFATAYLRKTSGAAFGASEVSNTIKEFFPLIGDSQKVIAQKEAARDRAVEGMKMSTSKEGRKYIEGYGGGGAPAGGGGIPNATPTNPLGLTIPGVR
jgi:hypothetical protein